MFTLSACNKQKLILIEGVQKIELRDCFNFGDTQYVVDSDDDVVTVFESNLREGCSKNDLPHLNFEEKTLLGQKTMLNSVATFDYEVHAVAGEDEFIYTVIINNSHPTENTTVQFHWISIPKLPDGYKVNFEVVEN